MPESWSAWVSFVGSIVAIILAGMSVAYQAAAYYRDRADIEVALTEMDAMKPFVKNQFPEVVFGPHMEPAIEPRRWFVATCINRGLRPVHIVNSTLIWVNPEGPGSFSILGPHDVVLKEEFRRTSIAFDPEQSGRKLWLAQFADDADQRYTVYGPEYASWISRWLWRIQRRRLENRDPVAVEIPASGTAATGSNPSDTGASQGKSDRGAR